MKNIFGLVLFSVGIIFLLMAIPFCLVLIELFQKPPPNQEFLLLAAFLVFGFLVVSFLSFLAIRGGLRLSSSGNLPLVGSKEENHGGLSPNTMVEMQTGDVPFSYHFRPKDDGEGGHPSQLIISVADSWGIPFLARRGKKYDSIGTRLGLSVPLVTEDDTFNQQVYIETNHIRAMEQYLARPGNRKALLEILDFGFENVICSEKGMEGQWTHYDLENRDMLADMNMAAQRLAFLSQGGSELQGLESMKMEGGEPRHIKLFKNTLESLSGVVIVVAILSFQSESLRLPAPLRYWDLFSLSLQSLVIIFPGYLVLTYYYLRGRTTSHRDWFVFGLLGLLVQVGCIPWTLNLVNV